MGVKSPMKRSRREAMQVMRRALDRGERRVLPFRCAVTGWRFYVICERAPGAETFSVAATEKENGEREGDLAAAAAADAPRKYRAHEFDMTGWACPWCGHAAHWVNCGACRQSVCGGRTWRAADGRLMIACHEACGNAGPAVEDPHVYGHAGGCDRTALPKPAWLSVGGSKV